MYFHKAQEKPRLYGSFQDRQYSIWRNLEDIYCCDHESEVLIMPGFWGFPLLDYSKYGNHGTNHGVTFRDGSLDFDGGDDYVDLGAGNSLDITSNITITAWIKTNTITATNRQIVAKYDGSSSSDDSYMFRLNKNDIELFLRTSSGTAWVNSNMDGVPLSTNCFVVGIYDGNNIISYINGVSGTPTIHTDTIKSNPLENVYIGANNIGGTVFNGIIDEVRISNVARTNDTIALFYDRPWDLYRRVARPIWSIPAAPSIYIPQIIMF